MITEAQRIERARRGEQAERPVRAEVKVRPDLGGQAVLRLYGGAGNVEVIQLGDGYQDADGRTRTLAVEQIHKRGFRLDGGWDEVDAYTLRSALDVTAEYLDYVARRFGPVPYVPQVDGMTVKARTQRGWWDVTSPTGRAYALVWVPRLGGDRWRIYGGPALSETVATGDSPAEVLDVLRFQ